MPLTQPAPDSERVIQPNYKTLLDDIPKKMRNNVSLYNATQYKTWTTDSVHSVRQGTDQIVHLQDFDRIRRK